MLVFHTVVPGSSQVVCWGPEFTSTIEIISIECQAHLTLWVARRGTVGKK